MRDYKFRGIIKGNEQETLHHHKWFYGDLVRELSTGRTFILDISHIFIVEAPFDTLGLEVIPETVGQFTGLHDKNGVEIYEGDIVQERGLRETWTLSRRDELSERKHVVTWCDYDLQWCGELIEDDEDYELDTRGLSFLERKYTLEVIGNIHEEVEE